ncbi:3-oxoacyl-[acyl-carrier-protein] synthase III C-terminal domain-containing protein (plasmid) [Tistrella bauzanensis]|uniref:3-oxoacyl-[acyl-carrier-protein] synthase III C-terminal domain-containing protein n=1 Tax=Tistrella TaxID=171436 RepID=UPI0031F6B0A9
MTFGITAFGAYVPRLRLSRQAIATAHRWMTGGPPRATGHRAFCSWDEDSVTMAVEAARDALAGAAGRHAVVSSLTLASTTLPYADFSNAGQVAAALDLDPSIRADDRTGSQRAATTALIDAFTQARDGTLIVAADRPRAQPASPLEQICGAGAASVILGGGDVIARLVGAASVNATFADHFRPADLPYDYVWEERWIRDEGFGKIVPQAVAAALASAGLTIGDIRYFVMPSTIRGAAVSVARTLGFKGEIADALDADCGHTGTAHALLMLGAVLEVAAAGDRILLVGFGQGADALVLEASGRTPAMAGARGVAAVLADRLATDDYLRMLSFYGGIRLDWGMRGEKNDKPALTEAYRTSRQLAAFKAGHCPACGAVQFPQLAYCVTPGCGASARDFGQVSLADVPADLMTFTADWLSYHPSPPLHVGFVQFNNGARLMMEVVDVPVGALEVGMALRMVCRIKQTDTARGFRRYFWKATPVALPG